MSLSENRLSLHVSVCIGLYQYVSAQYQDLIRKQGYLYVPVCIDCLFKYMLSITMYLYLSVFIA
jgi:hypothetical protein